jgi:hypothetical protein
MNSYPSIKSLSQIADCDPKLMRRILIAPNLKTLADIRAELAPQFDSTDRWVDDCYIEPKYHQIKMHMLDIAAGTYGVEYIPAGHNARSPAIEYLNAGDTYTTTLLFVRGCYRVGSWGGIVEYGNYD